MILEDEDMPTLYELTHNYINFLYSYEKMLESENVTEDDLQLLVDTLEAINDSIEVKTENIVKFLKNLEGDIEIFKIEEKRLQKKRKAKENTYNRLKKYLQDMLELADIKSVDTGLFKVRIQKSVPSVEVIDKNLIPETYKIAQEPKIDLRGLLEDLKLGKQIEGARLVDQNYHLRIL